MSRGDELLAAVIASPDDDAPRLVYADWLLERDDADSRARGELIQVQCALAAIGDDDAPDRARLVRRSARILAEHRARWTAEVMEGYPAARPAYGEGAFVAGFSRGFIDSIDLVDERYDVLTTNEDLDTLFARAPLLRQLVLDVSGWRMDRRVTTSIDAPALARLDRLTMRMYATMSLEGGASLKRLKDLRVIVRDMLEDDDEPSIADLVAWTPRLEAFATRGSRAPMLDGLPTGGPHGSRLVAELAASPCAPTLRRLVIHGAPLDDIASALVRDAFPALESLHVVSAAPDRWLAVLADERCWPRLHDIGLTVVNDGTRRGRWRSTDALTILDRRPGVDRLSLSGGDPGVVWPLLAHPAVRQLRALSLVDHHLGDDEAIAFSQATSLDALRALDLSRNEIGAYGVRALAGAPWIARLRSLSLRDDPAGDGGGWLARAPTLEGIEHLVLTPPIPDEVSALLRARFGAALVIAEPGTE